MSIKKTLQAGMALIIAATLSSCTYNPLLQDNHLTGNAGVAVLGGAVGAGATAWLGAAKPLVALAGIGGAGLGYYLTTLRFSSKGVLQGGGQVYTLGDYVGIVIPTDNLFDSNTHDFLPGTQPILDSIAEIVARYPNNNVMISGNMSGFGASAFENQLSEARAREIAGYLWAHGTNSFQPDSVTTTRKLIYVGYGNYFPIANNIHLKGIRENSRVQITIYPSHCKLHLDYRAKLFNNIGSLHEPCKTKEAVDVDKDFIQDYLPEGRDISKPTDWKDDTGYQVKPETDVDTPNEHVDAYREDVKGEMPDHANKNYNDIKDEPAAPAKQDYKNEGGFAGKPDYKNEFKISTRDFGDIRAHLEKKDTLIGPFDMLIAAHARALTPFSLPGIDKENFLPSTIPARKLLAL